MTEVAGPALRTFAFGDLEEGVWGVGWIPEAPADARVVLAAGASAAVAATQLKGVAHTEDWQLESDGAELTFSPVGDPVSATPGGFDQLCRVAGRFQLDSTEHRIASLGSRSTRSEALDLAALDSLRALAAWFEPGEGLTLEALRPRHAQGHGSDAVAAALFRGEDALTVADPRLSTTYTAAGRPVRAAVELWLEGEEDSEEESEPPQYPVRASGEATGAFADWTAGPLQAHAELFRWHSHGLDGAGVYLLLRPQ